MKRLSFYLLTRSQLLDLLRKYVRGVIPKYTEMELRDGFEHKKRMTVTYWIPGCDLAMNRYCLQSQTVNARWMHITSDPTRMSSTEYKNLPCVE